MINRPGYQRTAACYAARNGRHTSDRGSAWIGAVINGDVIAIDIQNAECAALTVGFGMSDDVERNTCRTGHLQATEEHIVAAAGWDGYWQAVCGWIDWIAGVAIHQTCWDVQCCHVERRSAAIVQGHSHLNRPAIGQGYVTIRRIAILVE